jgi:DNA modification methylase
MIYKYFIGDFTQIANDTMHEGYIADNSIDAIITDPPYPKEFLYVWKELAIFASRVLKPGGFLITYAPQYYLGRIMVDMNSVNGIAWYAQLVMTHDSKRSTIFPRKEICGYKPILVFQKLNKNGKTSKPYKSFLDIIKGSGREKGLHEWQQSQAELTPLIETFTLPGDTIVDPFMGSGTTLAASIVNGRNTVGYDINPDVEEKVRVRLNG